MATAARARLDAGRRTMDPGSAISMPRSTRLGTSISAGMTTSRVGVITARRTNDGFSAAMPMQTRPPNENPHRSTCEGAAANKGSVSRSFESTC